jgi:hypothetical protein
MDPHMSATCAMLVHLRLPVRLRYTGVLPVLQQSSSGAVHPWHGQAQQAGSVAVALPAAPVVVREVNAVGLVDPGEACAPCTAEAASVAVAHPVEAVVVRQQVAGADQEGLSKREGGTSTPADTGAHDAFSSRQKHATLYNTHRIAHTTRRTSGHKGHACAPPISHPAEFHPCRPPPPPAAPPRCSTLQGGRRSCYTSPPPHQRWQSQCSTRRCCWSRCWCTCGHSSQRSLSARVPGNTLLLVYVS